MPKTFETTKGLVFQFTQKECAQMIRDIQVELGMKSSQFAKYLGIIRNTYDMILQGRSYPSHKVYTALAARGYDLNDMFIVKQKDVDNAL